MLLILQLICWLPKANCRLCLWVWCRWRFNVDSWICFIWCLLIQKYVILTVCSSYTVWLVNFPDVCDWLKVWCCCLHCDVVLLPSMGGMNWIFWCVNCLCVLCEIRLKSIDEWKSYRIITKQKVKINIMDRPLTPPFWFSHRSLNQSLIQRTPALSLPPLHLPIHLSISPFDHPGCPQGRYKTLWPPLIHSVCPVCLSSRSLCLIPGDKLKAENIFPPIMEDLRDHLKLTRGFKT